MPNLNEYKITLQNESIKENALKEKFQLTKELFCLKDIKELRSTKKRLKEVQRNIQSILRIIEEATTFMQKDFINFLLKFLEITEKEKIGFGIFIETNPLGFFKNEFCEFLLIGKKEEVQRVKKIFGENALSKSIEKARIENYILIPLIDGKIHLAQGIELRSELQSFPSLQYVFERMIELFSDTKATQQEKLDSILQEIKENKKGEQERETLLSIENKLTYSKIHTMKKET